MNRFNERIEHNVARFNGIQETICRKIDTEKPKRVIEIPRAINNMGCMVAPYVRFVCSNCGNQRQQPAISYYEVNKHCFCQRGQGLVNIVEYEGTYAPHGYQLVWDKVEVEM